MVVTCHACQTKFRVDDSKIGARGVKVRCSKCSTMIIVKPEATQEIQAPPELGTPGGDLFGSSDDDAREPTKVMNAPLMNQMLQQSGADDEDSAPPNPLAQMPMPPQIAKPPPPPSTPPVLAAPPPQTPSPPPLGAPLGLPTPPPLAPPPLKSMAPTLNAPIGTEKPPGTWQTQDAPPPAVEAPLGDDLFSDPFATPAAPPPETSEPPQRFADLQPSSGPSLELDLPSKSSAPPPADDPLAGMPKFDQQEDQGPQFEGAMSEEGMVTKPTALQDMQEERTAVRELPKEFREKERAAAAEAKPEAKKPATRVVKSRKVVAIVGYAAIALLVVAGLFGEYMLFRAGGYEGLLGHADRLSTPSSIGVELGRVTLAPYVSELGQRFVLVRGEVHNKNASAAPPFSIDVAVDGKRVTTAVPGSTVDVVALHRDGRIEARAPQDASLGPNETKLFTVAIAAPADAKNLVDALTFTLMTK